MKRWYDSHPTMSMAISLLQNTPVRHRDYTIRYVLSRLQQLDERVVERAAKQPKGFWACIQKRKAMDNASWMVIESLQFLSAQHQDLIAHEIISSVYLLETYEAYDIAELSADEIRECMAV